MLLTFFSFSFNRFRKHWTWTAFSQLVQMTMSESLYLHLDCLEKLHLAPSRAERFITSASGGIKRLLWLLLSVGDYWHHWDRIGGFIGNTKETLASRAKWIIGRTCSTRCTIVIVFWPCAALRAIWPKRWDNMSTTHDPCTWGTQVIIAHRQT